MLTGTRKPTVFVVEDDDSVRRSLGRLLRTVGFDVRLYGDSAKFLREVTTTPAACVVLDVTMPHLGGLQIQARLKQLGIRIPVIMITAHDDDATRRKAQQGGARFYFRKPVDDHELIDAIECVLRPGPGENAA